MTSVTVGGLVFGRPSAVQPAAYQAASATPSKAPSKQLQALPDSARDDEDRNKNTYQVELDDICCHRDEASLYSSGEFVAQGLHLIQGGRVVAGLHRCFRGVDLGDE